MKFTKTVIIRAQFSDQDLNTDFFLGGRVGGEGGFGVEKHAPTRDYASQIISETGFCDHIHKLFRAP